MKFLKKYKDIIKSSIEDIKGAMRYQNDTDPQEIVQQEIVRQVSEPDVKFDPEYVRSVLLDFSLDLKDKDCNVLVGYNDATNKYLIYIFKLTYDLPGVYRDTPEIRSLLADYNEVSGYSSFDSITSYHIGRNLSDIKFFNRCSFLAAKRKIFYF